MTTAKYIHSSSIYLYFFQGGGVMSVVRELIRNNENDNDLIFLIGLIFNKVHFIVRMRNLFRCFFSLQQSAKNCVLFFLADFFSNHGIDNRTEKVALLNINSFIFKYALLYLRKAGIWKQSFKPSISIETMSKNLIFFQPIRDTEKSE